MSKTLKNFPNLIDEWLHKLNDIWFEKELFKLDGKTNDFSEEDKGRRNTIVALLAEWGLITPLNAEQIVEPTAPLSQIKILPHKEKNDWELVAKYSIGKKR